MRQSSPQRRGLSLERKLPFLIGGLVALALTAALLLVGYELRNSAFQASSERLSLVTQQIVQVLDQTVEARRQITGQIAQNPDIVGLASAAGGSVEGAQAALRRLQTGTDRSLPVVLMSASGRPITAVGPVPPAETLAALRRGDDFDWGTLDPTDDGGYTFWMTVPVRSGGSIVGHIAQQRRGGSRGQTVQFVERIIGSDIELFFADRQGATWGGLDSGLTPAVPITTVDAPFTYTGPDGTPYFAYARRVGGIPWHLVARMPLATVTARVDPVLRRIAMAGTVVFLLGLLAAWLLSRRVTAPLRRLAGAADAIAAGDYSRRANLQRDDEIGRLADSFDAMAARVDATHAQLEHRFHEARTLAAELELTNARLQHAIEDAETARREAQQASSAKSEFLATMSHEIRTPINAIIGYTDLMDMRLPGPLTPEQDDYVRRIRISSEHLISLVNDVLDFAKIESGQMRIAREQTSARTVIDAAVSMLQGRAQSRRITLLTDLPGDVAFSGDPQRAQQILLNLLSNALKFTGDDGTIEITCERRESRAVHGDDTTAAWTCISVRDNGIGIPDDQLGPIFEPFVQGAGGYTRTHGGTGLGLAISRSLARMMDGDLTVESEPGVGSTFTLWLPAAPSAIHATR